LQQFRLLKGHHQTKTLLMKHKKGHITAMHYHPSYLCCPDVLSMVGDPLSGKGCGSPNHL